jgi:alpha-galactosidase
MITFNNNVFELELENSQYLMAISETGHLLHLYYGEKIKGGNTVDMQLDYAFEQGRSTCYDVTHKPFNLGTALLEVATFGKGDYREPSLHIELEDGSRVTDFIYDSHRIYEGKEPLEGLPATTGSNKTLEITLIDKINDIQLLLSYSLFEGIDVIARSLKVVNGTKQKIVLDRIMSMCIDYPNDDYDLMTLDGSWIREGHIHTRPIVGINKIDSKKGVSSADHNPSFILKEKTTTETYGKAYGFSLVYSSNFEAILEANSHGLLRVMMGINSFDFKWPLEKGATFQTPEVVMTFSNKGLNGMSRHFHEVIRHHLVNGEWQYKERPILINNWEATYFDFTEKKLVNLAKKAKALGVELFVLDDGWFSNREDDTKGLGDYHPNTKKLPHGIPGLAKKINALGLDFGIWVEPEMVNENSRLYEEHPEWAVKLPNREPSYGRNQLVLDLANEAVTDYIYQKLHELFSCANISYCKWDMNRNFSDVYSNALCQEEQYGYYHRYILGLYKVLEQLKQDFPHMLFEACCSGGSRFDMGMLYYMPQVWTSDNTDGYCRQKIQYGTSLIYPPSVMGNHVSASPNHQTFRSTSIETRFNVAAFGLLGYELDLTKLTPTNKKAVKEQISYYKNHRKLLQFGEFNRLSSPFESNICLWQVSAKDNSEVLVGYYQKETLPNPNNEKLIIPYVDKESTYQLTNRNQLIDIRVFGNLINHELPVKLKVNGLIHNTVANHYEFFTEKEDKAVTGSMLAAYGFRPKQQFTGTGFNEKVRIMEDFGSRLYYLKRIS